MLRVDGEDLRRYLLSQLVSFYKGKGVGDLVEGFSAGHS